MAYQGTLTVSFLSEWHCGTGAGKHGGVDRTIALDEDGLPYVPGRTLKGVWRTACERVAHALDDGKRGEWSRLVRALFGDPALAVHGGGASRGLVHVRDGRLGAAWRERLDGDESDVLLPGLRVTRAGVAISDVTGTARPDHLRFIEFARGGLDVQADFSVEAPAHWAIELVLGAGLREVTALGAHRRRGAGRCRVGTDALPDAATLAAEHGSDVAAWRLNSIELRPLRPPAESTPTTPAPTSLVRARRVLLTLRQPVVVTRAVLGNLMLSHDFVPGATLLPLVAQALGSTASALIRAGQVVVTDAVPTPGAERMARTPLALVSGEKGAGWLANGDDVHDARDGVRDPSDRPVGGWALRRDDGNWRIHRSGLTTTAHASIDDASQRTLENGVYTIQAIPVGSRLAFDVWLPGDIAETFALPERAAIGRYRQDSYGLVDIEMLPAPANDPADDLDADATLSLWLTSDSCIETLPGLPDTTPHGFAKAVEDALASEGVRATLMVVEEETFTTVARRDSWSGSVSLPRATIVGLGAGSVVTLRTDIRIAGAALRTVLDRGVGERRAEGFGRCRLLPRSDALGIAPWSDNAQVPALDDALRHQAPEGWDGVRRAIWRTELEQRISVIMTDQNVRETFLAGSATASNLGTLRTAAMELAHDPGAVDRWLSGTLDHDVRKKGWEGVADTLVRHFGAASLGGASTLYAWFGANRSASAQEVPADLGGNAPCEVASWLLVECVRRQVAANKESSGRES